MTLKLTVAALKLTSETLQSVATVLRQKLPAPATRQWLRSIVNEKVQENGQLTIHPSDSAVQFGEWRHCVQMRRHAQKIMFLKALTKQFTSTPSWRRSSRWWSTDYPSLRSSWFTNILDDDYAHHLLNRDDLIADGTVLIRIALWRLAPKPN